MLPNRAEIIAGRLDHPLHDAGAPDADCCYLTHTGRRSGRRYETEIWFGALRDTIYIVSGNGEGADWYRNALAAGSLDVRIGATTWTAVAARAVTNAGERELAGWLLAHRYPMWNGDPEIGLTRDTWCWSCPVLAVDLESPAGAFERAATRVDDGSSTADEEARHLVAMMTTAEQLGCLDGDIDAWPGLFEMMAGGYHRRSFPAAAVERLGIPGIRFSDGPRGCVIGEKTAFPVSMARGATWDPELERRIGVAIGTELRSVGADFYGGVCINLLRHPGWGRAQETYGEEPHHVGVMGAALAAGAQQRVMACVKHFAVNSMENARFKVDVTVDERALHEVYLPHFRRVVDGGVAAVMSAYNSLNGAFCGENHPLLTGILRDEWGFDGIVVSDFIFGLRDPVASVTAGLDVEMPFRQQRMMHLPGALADGRLTTEDVERAVRRIVGTQLRFRSLLTDPANPESFDAEAHRALAREAATASIVLLRNQNGVLPLSPGNLRRVAVIGRLAAIPNLGDKGSSEVITGDVVTPLAGLRAALPGIAVDHHDFDAAVAEGADVAIVVVGCTYRDEGEFIDAAGTAGLLADHFPPMTEADRVVVDAARPTAPAPSPGTDAGGPTAVETFAPGGDRRSIRLSDGDARLVTEVAARCPDTVVVVMGSSAVVMDPWRDHVPGIVMLWYPGVEGGHALADVLLGVANPSGRLPFSIPTSENHLPHWDPDADAETYDMWHGHWRLRRDGNPAAYPFGYGMSYTSFEIGDTAVEPVGRQLVRLSGVVHNRGDVAGTEVVQVYAGLPASVHERPQRRLVGFTRVEVEAGGLTPFSLDVDLGELAVRIDGAWHTEPGVYALWVARHAEDPSAWLLTATVESSPRETPPRS